VRKLGRFLRDDADSRTGMRRDFLRRRNKKPPVPTVPRGAKESAYNRERLDGDGFLLPPLSVLSDIRQVDKGVGRPPCQLGRFAVRRYALSRDPVQTRLGSCRQRDERRKRDEELRIRCFTCS